MNKAQFNYLLGVGRGEVREVQIKSVKPDWKRLSKQNRDEIRSYEKALKKIKLK